MQRPPSTGFEDSYRRHLVIEQRKAVLETIARELNPATTLGDIVDAAQELGWGDAMGELNLGDLALALFGESAVVAPAGDDLRAPAPDDDDLAAELAADAANEDLEDVVLDEDGEEEEEEEEEPRPAPKAAKSSGKKASKKAAKAKPAKVTKKKAAKAAAQAQTVLPIIPPAPASGSKNVGKNASKKAAKKAAKKAPAPPPPPPVDEDEDEEEDEAMNLEQAARKLIPLVKKLKEATMQDLEEQTGMGRRKLRFHIGQLVKHGRLKRHGMGRGTCYTVK